MVIICIITYPGCSCCLLQMNFTVHHAVKLANNLKQRLQMLPRKGYCFVNLHLCFSSGKRQAEVERQTWRSEPSVFCNNEVFSLYVKKLSSVVLSNLVSKSINTKLPIFVTLVWSLQPKVDLHNSITLAVLV